MAGRQSTAIARVWAFLKARRHVVSRLVLVAAGVVGATQIWPDVPRATALRLDLGPEHREIMELQVAVSRAGEDLYGAQFRFPSGAPSTVRHEITLPTGVYELQVLCRRQGGVTTVARRTVALPAEGTLQVAATGDGA